MNLSDLESKFSFVAVMCADLTNREYEKALRSFKAGIHRLSEKPEEIDNVELLKSLDFLADFFLLSAGDDFGVELREKALPKQVKDPACSFCGKTKSEVKVIVAGYGAYICESCVEICRAAINSELEGEAGKK